MAIVLAKLLSEDYDQALAVQIAAFCVVLGHTFPIFFGFRGGKGVATSIGVLLVLNWEIGICFNTNGII